MGDFERYEMGAFPLRDGHFENLARAPAYPQGWASGQVLLSSGVGCLGTAQKRKLFNLLVHCFNRCFGVPFSVLRKVDYDVNCVTVHEERLLIMKQWRKLRHAHGYLQWRKLRHANVVGSGWNLVQLKLRSNWPIQSIRKWAQNCSRTSRSWDIDVWKFDFFKKCARENGREPGISRPIRAKISASAREGSTRPQKKFQVFLMQDGQDIDI